MRRLVWSGALKAVQFNGKNTSIRIAESVLEEWLQGRFAGSGGDQAA